MLKKSLSKGEVIILTLSVIYLFLFFSTRYIKVAIPDVTEINNDSKSSSEQVKEATITPAERDAYIHKIYDGLVKAYGPKGALSPEAFLLSFDSFTNKIRSSATYANKIYYALDRAYGSLGDLSPGAFSLSEDEFLKKINVQDASKPENYFDTISANNPTASEKNIKTFDDTSTSKYTTTIYSWREYEAVVEFKGNSTLGLRTRTDAIKFRDIHVFFLSLKRLAKNQVTAYSFLKSITVVCWIVVVVISLRIALWFNCLYKSSK